MNNFLESQVLISAFLGPFFGVIFSAIGFLIVRKINKQDKIKETLRRIEASTAYSMNSIFIIQQKIDGFADSSGKLVSEIKAITNQKEYSLQTINFPVIGEIYIDDETPRFVTKSYYLHNKLLWIHAAVIDINRILASLKDSWERILEMNGRMVELMKDNPNPTMQRRTYIGNIEAFSTEVSKFKTEGTSQLIDFILQVKVYNELLRQPFGKGRFWLWKFESATFKCFKNKASLQKFTKNLDSLDRIDLALKDKKILLKEDIKKRAEEKGTKLFV